MNGNISWVYELEDLALLRWQYSPQWYTDLVQSLIDSEWLFFIKGMETIILS
jgi:hypothetical protein